MVRFTYTETRHLRFTHTVANISSSHVDRTLTDAAKVTPSRLYPQGYRCKNTRRKAIQRRGIPQHQQYPYPVCVYESSRAFLIDAASWQASKGFQKVSSPTNMWGLCKMASMVGSTLQSSCAANDYEHESTKRAQPSSPTHRRCQRGHQ